TFSFQVPTWLSAAWAILPKTSADTVTMRASRGRIRGRISCLLLGSNAVRNECPPCINFWGFFGFFANSDTRIANKFRVSQIPVLHSFLETLSSIAPPSRKSSNSLSHGLNFITQKLAGALAVPH